MPNLGNVLSSFEVWKLCILGCVVGKIRDFNVTFETSQYIDKKLIFRLIEFEYKLHNSEHDP